MLVRTSDNFFARPSAHPPTRRSQLWQQQNFMKHAARRYAIWGGILFFGVGVNKLAQEAVVIHGVEKIFLSHNADSSSSVQEPFSDQR